MGLDITVYRNLTPAPDAEVDDDGYPVEWDSHLLITQSLIDMQEKTFPGRLQLAAGIYHAEETDGFRAGSYIGYSLWRNWLATVAGFPDAQTFWHTATPAAPFYELINFTDCEGLLGAQACGRLAVDFDAITPDGDDWQLALYAKWKNAVTMAAQNGAIEFH